MATKPRTKVSGAAPGNRAGGADLFVSLSTLKRTEIADILEKLSQKDRKLKALMAKVESGFALKIQDADSPFEAIAEAIVYQQLTGKAAATIFGRVKETCGNGLCPSPAQIARAPETVLRTAGLSKSKIAALKDLAEKSISGHIPTMDEIGNMSDEEIISVLTTVRGVGTWTAQMFLMFRLGRLDVMPSGDYGVRKGFALTYGDGEDLPTPAQLEQHAELWRPYRSVGSWYMWRATEVYRRPKAVAKKVEVKAPAKRNSAQKPNATKITIKTEKEAAKAQKRR